MATPEKLYITTAYVGEFRQTIDEMTKISTHSRAGDEIAELSELN